MTEETLFSFIKIVLLILVLYWILIAVSLVYRRVRTARLLKIEHTFAEVISLYLYKDPENPISLKEINTRLKRVGIRPGNTNNVQFMIKLMIRTQRAVVGHQLEKLQKLYGQIPPYGVSLHKINSWNWYRKARGIREIYEMNQSRYLDRILKYRNHRNIFVRREAQIAMVVFLGWESLRFLPYLKRNMTLWQQIKIVEKLYDLYPQPQVKLLRAAYTTEKLFAKKLLMRIIRKYELHAEVDFIISCLDHEDYELRETAIYCLQTFAVSSKKMKTIKEVYNKIPDDTQQAQLLQYIFNNSEIDLEFYLRELYGPNENLKLRIAEILWHNGHKEKVQEFYYHQYSQKDQYVG